MAGRGSRELRELAGEKEKELQSLREQHTQLLEGAVKGEEEGRRGTVYTQIGVHDDYGGIGSTWKYALVKNHTEFIKEGLDKGY